MNKFSFIIPVYNCQSYLSDCVKGIQKIGLSNYEILLIDDESEDNSGKICDSLAEAYSEIRCFHQNNSGVSSARNRGIDLANGDYIVFLDADDSINSSKLYDLTEIVNTDPSIDMAIFGLSFDYYYRKKCYRSDELKPPIVGKIQSSKWIKKISELYDANAISPIWNKIIKRSVLRDNDLRFKENMFLYEDMEFSLQCMAHCDFIYFSPEIIYHYRQPEDEGNAGRRLKKIEHISLLIDQIESALDELIKKQHVGANEDQIKNILIDLYLVLVKEKISASNKEEICIICDDFSAWLEKRTIQISNEHKTFIDCLLNQKVFHLMFRRNYIAIRHRIAVRVKSMKWYQKKKLGG
ncbi:MAG: glycosyltransferase [Clostridia bacterium]|nr:glycosyltransferase [Clostridia bacterium]